MATTGNGEYVLAVAGHGSRGIRIVKTSKWDIHDHVKNTLLLGSSVNLGLECHWVPKYSPEFHPSIKAETESIFTPRVHEAQSESFIQPVEQNLGGIYPSDAYLCTLPLHFIKHHENSFLSVAAEEFCFKIGVVINCRLLVVFSIPKTTDLRSFIARLERYWLLRCKETQFPNKIYLLNDFSSFSNLKEVSEQLNLCKKFDIAEIKAIGLAFCSNSSVPCFAGASEKSRLRHLRAVAYFTSLALLLCCCILLFGIIGMRYYYSSRIEKCENQYRELLTNNKEFRELLNSGSQLSKKLLRMENFSSSRTQWSRFLHELGSQKIQGLYYEQLGCDIEDSKGVIRIALTGWAESEKVVTEMIKRMNTSGMFKNIQLTSLDKDDVQKERCRFKLICSLNFSTK